MSKKSRAHELAGFSVLVVFANDATINEGELAMLEKLALEDDQVDAQEKEVLRNIFDRMDSDSIAAKVLEEVTRFRAEHNI